MIFSLFWVFHVIFGVFCVLSFDRSAILLLSFDLLLCIAVVKAIIPTIGTRALVRDGG